MLNEWFFHHLALENGETNFRETGRFLASLQNSADRLVVPDKKRWRDKAFRLIGNGIPQVRLAGRLFNNILRDSEPDSLDHCRRDAVILPVDRYSGIPEEDVYLIRSYVASKSDLLVTSDTGLCQACESISAINCQLRDDFLKKFAIQ